MEQRHEEGTSKDEPIFDKENLFILMKIIGERRSTNTDLWSMVIENVDELLLKEAFDIKDLSQIVDCYYKLLVAQPDHQ